eukprot:360237_1
MAAVAGTVQVGLDYLNKNKGNINQFIEDPENFAMESLRYAGLPSSGRTVFAQSENLKVDGDDVLMEKGQSVIHGILEINRCPYKFKNGDDFDPTRSNLKKDVFIFGNREEVIRNHTAQRACPLHNFDIVLVQELIARLYELSGLQIKY